MPSLAGSKNDTQRNQRLSTGKENYEKQQTLYITSKKKIQTWY